MCSGLALWSRTTIILYVVQGHFSVESVDDKGVNLLFFSTLVEKLSLTFSTKLSYPFITITLLD